LIDEPFNTKSEIAIYLMAEGEEIYVAEELYAEELYYTQPWEVHIRDRSFFDEHLEELERVNHEYRTMCCPRCCGQSLCSHIRFDVLCSGCAFVDNYDARYFVGENEERFISHLYDNENHKFYIHHTETLGHIISVPESDLFSFKEQWRNEHPLPIMELPEESDDEFFDPSAPCDYLVEQEHSLSDPWWLD